MKQLIPMAGLAVALSVTTALTAGEPSTPPSSGVLFGHADWLPSPLFMAYADGLLFGCSEQLSGPGHIYLIETRPALKVVGKAMLPSIDLAGDSSKSERRFVYSSPVISAGVMYLRHFDELFAFDIVGR